MAQDGNEPRTGRVRCSRAIMQTIVDAGVEVLFNLPGRGVWPLLDELAQFPDIRYVSALHEGPLVTMADGYSRASRRRPAFVNVCMGSGVLNATSAIFLAQRDRIPLVITATQVESSVLGAGDRCEAHDIVRIVEPLTKWSATPTRADRVLEHLRRAIAIALTPPQGPVFVPIPVDFLYEDIEYADVGARPEVAAVALDAPGGAVVRTARLLRDCRAPVLVVGAEAVAAGAASPAREIAELVGCPVLAEPEPPALPLASDDRHFGGAFDHVCRGFRSGRTDAAESILGDADLVVSIGVNTYEPWQRPLFETGVPKRHVQIASDGSELHKIVPSDVALVAELRSACTALLGELRSDPAAVDHPHWRDTWSALIEGERAFRQQNIAKTWDELPLGAARLCTELRRRMPANTLFVDQATTYGEYVRDYIPVDDGESYMAASGSCQGWGVGAAIGAKIARPNEPVVAIVGDGGLMFSAQALWTAVSYDVRLLVVVNDNGGWRSMRNGLANGAPNTLATRGDLGFHWDVDLAGLCTAFGAYTAHVKEASELGEAIDGALAALEHGPAVLVVAGPSNGEGSSTCHEGDR